MIEYLSGILNFSFANSQVGGVHMINAVNNNYIKEILVFDLNVFLATRDEKVFIANAMVTFYFRGTHDFNKNTMRHQLCDPHAAFFLFVYFGLLNTKIKIICF